MGSDTGSSGGRSFSPFRKTKVKIPKRIHKAEREKQKREHLNELFQDLANALELNQPNNGKASILCEASRLLKEIFGQIDGLKKENVALLSESHYVTVEKNELKMENSDLEAQIEKLRNELRARVAESNPDLNVPPSPEYEEPDFPSFRIPNAAEANSLQQGCPTVLIVPINPDLSSSFPMQMSQVVSKPNPRYPTAGDSWPSQLLGEPVTRRKEAQLSGRNS